MEWMMKLRPKIIQSLLFYLSCCFIITTEAFNLDSRIPVVKRGFPNSFFGYSVAEHLEFARDSTNRSHLLIGAPRANTTQSNSFQPGTVFDCPLTTRSDDCREVNLQAFIGSSPSEEDPTDGWLGVSLQSRGPGGQVVACAHRYKKKDRDFIWGLGLCHLFTQELVYEDPYEPCVGMKTLRGHEDFGFCQAGISSELAEDGTLTVGTPGVLNWRGGVFSIAVDREQSFGQDKRWFSSEITEYRAFVNKVSYLGMSVSSGYFIGGKQMVYVAGAPRANLTGEVFLFRKQVDGTNRTLELLAKLEGEQVASQFGYSLASVDLNNDSLPDLIVGAPFFFQTEPTRGGAVYIYMNNDEGIQYVEPKKLLGPAESSFGFSVADGGDLNLDGFNELVVGVPYDGRGSIYIYQGSATGIGSEPSQIIKAADLPIPGLRTLGYSLSGGIDLDGNGYPDLLSGAYGSDLVVLLRARPVIKVFTEVSDLPKYVNDPNRPTQYCIDSASGKNVTCFSFRPCFQIASQSLNNFNGQMSIEYRIEAETFQKNNRILYSRVKFQDATDQPNPNVIKRIVVVTANTWRRQLCDTQMKEMVLIQENARDVLNPIWFKLTYTLLIDPPVFPQEGAPLPRINDYPILDQTNASKIFQVQFYKDCGTNDICESDLRITATLNLPKESEDQYILSLGENNQLFMNFTLRNENEAAYQTMFYARYPGTLDYIGHDDKKYSCSQTTIPFLLRCEIGNPFPRNGEVTISMRFSLANLQPLDREITFVLYANTTSTTIQPAQESLNLTAKIVVRADIEIRGASDPSDLFYSGFVTGASGIKSEDQIGLSVNHTFEVRNRGPAKLSSSKVTIHWPLEVENGYKNGKYLLYLLEPPITDGPVVCQIDPQYINPVGVKRIAKDLKIADINLSTFVAPVKTTISSPSNAAAKRTKREKVVQHEERIVENKRIKVVRLDCERGTAKCININCHIRELNRDQPVVIKLRARLWNSTFIEDYREIDTVEIKSSAEVRVDTSYVVEDVKGNNAVSILTIVRPDVSLISESADIPWWVWLLAVLGGIVLLALLIYCLYRCGFFKRNKGVKSPPSRRQTPSEDSDEVENTPMTR